MKTKKPVMRSLIQCGIVGGLLVLISPKAQALKMTVRVTPETLDPSGFTMKVQDRKDGTIEFTVARDLSKARSFAADSHLQVRRSATLELSNKSGLLATCSLEPDERRNTVVYRFVIARDTVPYSHFTIAEVDDYKDESREHLLGGGTFYVFRLAGFANRTVENRSP